MEEYGLLIFCGIVFFGILIIEVIYKIEKKKDSKKSFTVYVYKKFKYIASEYKISKRQGNFDGYPLLEKDLESYAMLLEEVAIDFINIPGLKKQILILDEWEQKYNTELQKEFENSIAKHNPIKEIYKEKENIKSAVLNVRTK